MMWIYSEPQAVAPAQELSWSEPQTEYMLFSLSCFSSFSPKCACHHYTVFISFDLDEGNEQMHFCSS